MKNMHTKILSAVIVLLLLVNASCKKADITGLPTVTTDAAVVLNDTSATLGGNVTSDGGSAVTARGVAINTAHSPTITDMIVDFGTGTGAFTSGIEGFTPGVTYYVRVYATNSKGTAYGNEISFNTTGTGCNIVLVNSTINTNTTWTKGNVYIVDGERAIDATLTIQPGVIVKFKANASFSTSNGNIQAIGTAADPIVFTAYTDDTYCGDNNGDGALTQGTKGYWGGIALKSNTASNFTYCKILFAGANVSNGAGTDKAVEISSGSDHSIFDHCTIANTSGASLDYVGALYFRDVYSCVVTNNIFYGNGVPIGTTELAAANFIGTTNTFHNPSNPSEKNKYQGVFLNYLRGSATVAVTLSLTELPYMIRGFSQITISNGINITLANNVVLKFDHGTTLSYSSSSGAGFVNGQGTGVLFTSITDDTGGDTNGDASATSPAAGDWEGLYDSDIAGADKWVHWANITYGNH